MQQKKICIASILLLLTVHSLMVACNKNSSNPPLFDTTVTTKPTTPPVVTIPAAAFNTDTLIDAVADQGIGIERGGNDDGGDRRVGFYGDGGIRRGSEQAAFVTARHQHEMEGQYEQQANGTDFF